VQYLLLQPFIVILCLMVLRIPPPEPSSRYLITDFSCGERRRTTMRTALSLRVTR
jgi:hypothetical protein